MKRIITFKNDTIDFYAILEAQQEFCKREGMPPTHLTINQAHKKSLIKETEDNQSSSTVDKSGASFKMTVNWSTEIPLNKLEFSVDR